MDWFSELGIYLRLLPGSEAMAFDLATTPGLDAESMGYQMVYHMQKMPESISTYPEMGFAGGV